LLVETGRVETGRRGAKPKRYELRSGALSALSERLAAINALASAGGVEDRQEEQALPSGLLAAEETLLALGERDPERLRHEASIGWLGFDTGERALQASPAEENPELEKHLAIVKALLGLVELEQADADGGPIDEEQIGVASRLFEAAQALAPEWDLQAALDARLRESPIGERLSSPLVDVMFAGAAEREIEQVVHVLSEQAFCVRQADPVLAPRRRRAQFGVLVLGEGSEREDLRLGGFANEPMIVVDAIGNRRELAERLLASRRSTIYLGDLAHLVTAVSFIRDVGDSWSSVGPRLFSR
jgi:hypothetical protein